jgi:hypothetical protein
MKDRRAERKDEAKDRRRLEQKYRPLRGIYLQIWVNAAVMSTALNNFPGTPCWLLEHIEKLQEQYGDPFPQCLLHSLADSS